MSVETRSWRPARHPRRKFLPTLRLVQTMVATQETRGNTSEPRYRDVSLWLEAEQELSKEIRDEAPAVDLRVMGEKNSVFDSCELQVRNSRMPAQSTFSVAAPEANTLRVSAPYQQARRLLESRAIAAHVSLDDANLASRELTVKHAAKHNPGSRRRRILEVAALARS